MPVGEESAGDLGSRDGSFQEFQRCNYVTQSLLSDCHRGPDDYEGITDTDHAPKVAGRKFRAGGLHALSAVSLCEGLHESVEAGDLPNLFDPPAC